MPEPQVDPVNSELVHIVVAGELVLLADSPDDLGRWQRTFGEWVGRGGSPHSLMYGVCLLVASEHFEWFGEDWPRRVDEALEGRGELGRVAGDLVWAAGVGSEEGFDRILDGFLDAGGSGTLLLYELCSVVARSHEAQFGDAWEGRIRLVIYDIQLEVERALAEAERLDYVSGASELDLEDGEKEDDDEPH